jgi:hypothetical protein
MESTKNNYFIAILLLLVAFYYAYTKAYFNALGWILLSFTIFLGIYLTRIGASKKYFYMTISLAILAVICFVLEIFY